MSPKCHCQCQESVVTGLIAENQPLSPQNKWIWSCLWSLKPFPTMYIDRGEGETEIILAWSDRRKEILVLLSRILILRWVWTDYRRYRETITACKLKNVPLLFNLEATNSIYGKQKFHFRARRQAPSRHDNIANNKVKNVIQAAMQFGRIQPQRSSFKIM